MVHEDDELLKDFIIESQEHLAKVESQLLELESNNDTIDVAKVNHVFRAIHSIKGVAGFLNLEVLEKLAHREEETLNLLRNHEIRPTSAVINTLLSASDRIKSLLDKVGTSNDEDVSEHMEALESLLSDPSNLINPNLLRPRVSNEAPDVEREETENVSEAPVSVPFNPSVLRDFLIESHDGLEQVEAYLLSLERNPEDQETLHALFRTIHTLKGSSGFLGFRRVEAIAHGCEHLFSEMRAGHLKINTDINSTLFEAVDHIRRHLSSIEQRNKEEDVSSEHILQSMQRLLVDTNPAAAQKSKISSKSTPKNENRTDSPLPQDKENHNSQARKGTPSLDSSSPSIVSESTIRVDVALLDKLMTRVGELVLARNQILQYSNLHGDSDLQSASQRLNLITTELQEGVMKTRMQPIGNVWGKFPRLVRDLAQICGKSVRIEMEGKETELDKTIIEAIKDPLTHLVRNTVDHGIEKPEIRTSKGKSAEGCLFLRAYHEGGQVNIEISDDGGGLNLERIKAKALENGLITPEQASKLNDRETSQLIFLPGFSTAEKVSNVSGRGVGMDVVKTNIERIGGTVDLQSTDGKGTSIRIKIPLTLAIIPALIITDHNNRFAIPQVNLLELVRLENSETKSEIEWIQGSPVYRLRGRLLPLVYLHQILKANPSDEGKSDSTNIVVLRVDDRQFGLVVDRINDTEEIVVKPMGKQLKGVEVFAGATIMGDGKVALILDVLGIARRSHIISKDHSRSMLDSGVRNKEEANQMHTLLLLDIGEQRHVALPISQVARLEKIPVDSIEQTNDREVVQYRGKILPLIRLRSLFHIEEEHSPEDGLLNVIIYTESENWIGFVVNRIVDIVETPLEIARTRKKEGLLGSAIIHGNVTELLDVPQILKQLCLESQYDRMLQLEEVGL